MFRVQIIFVLVVATSGYRIDNGEHKVHWSPHKLYFPGPISRPDPDKRIYYTPRTVVTKPPDNNVTPAPVVTKCPNDTATPTPIVTKASKDNATPTPVVTKPPEENDLVPENLCTLTAVPPDPDSECCGVEATSSNRIVGGNVTQLEQYPWLVLIQYYNKVQDRYKNLCGGFLISGRYVVSAAHCFVGEVLEYGTPINVILGDYNTTNEGPDCAKTMGGGTACTEGAITVPIESVLVFPEHYHNRTVSYNDIALIRLKTTVKYSKYIRPICLPTSDVTVASPPDLRFYAAGWGAVKQRLVFELGQKFFAGEYDFVKHHVDLPYVVNEKCRDTFTFVDKGHICAGGERGKDSCKGDSGGPLMYENDGIFEVIGIVSTGPLKKPCGTEGYPAVYTKVFDYVDWIKKSIKS